MSAPHPESLIPHRAPMRLIEEIVGETEEGFVCRGRIPADLAVDGGASPTLGVEMGAQAAAVHAALERRAEGAEAARVGYLVSIRDARFHGSSLPAERPLTARVRPRGGVHPLATYEIDILDGDGEPLVTATIGTFVVS